jgi:hypothetical protein
MADSALGYVQLLCCQSEAPFSSNRDKRLHLPAIDSLAHGTTNDIGIIP